MPQKPYQRMSYTQKKALLNLVEKDKQTLDRLRGPECRPERLAWWQVAADRLNEMGGACKSAEGWLKTFKDMMVNSRKAEAEEGRIAEAFAGDDLNKSRIGVECGKKLGLIDEREKDGPIKMEASDTVGDDDDDDSKTVPTVFDTEEPVYDIVVPVRPEDHPPSSPTPPPRGGQEAPSPDRQRRYRRHARPLQRKPRIDDSGGMEHHEILLQEKIAALRENTAARLEKARAYTSIAASIDRAVDLLARFLGQEN